MAVAHEKKTRPAGYSACYIGQMINNGGGPVRPHVKVFSYTAFQFWLKYFFKISNKVQV